MKIHGVSVYDGTDYVFMAPYIYTNGAWQLVTAYINTDGAWKTVGAACTQMIPLIDSNGNQEYVGGGPFLVREAWGDGTKPLLIDVYERKLVDKNDKELTGNDGTV